MIKPYHCPLCGFVFEAATAVGQAAIEGRKPEPGSLLVCIDCGEICVLGCDWQARSLSEQEAMDLPADIVGMLATVENARQTVMRRNRRDPFGKGQA